MSPHDPVHAFIDNYIKLLPESDSTEFQKVLEMKVDSSLCLKLEKKWKYFTRPKFKLCFKNLRYLFVIYSFLHNICMLHVNKITSNRAVNQWMHQLHRFIYPRGVHGGYKCN